jgi:hypothetical protein
MGLADIHQYPPSKRALENAMSQSWWWPAGQSVELWQSATLSLTQLICVNGSDEELDLNRPADHLLLSDLARFWTL